MTHCSGGGVSLSLLYHRHTVFFYLRNAGLTKVKIPCAIYRLALTDLERIRMANTHSLGSM